MLILANLLLFNLCNEMYFDNKSLHSFLILFLKLQNHMQKSVKFTTFPIESQTCMAYATSISLLNLVSEMVNVTRHSFNTSLSLSLSLLSPLSLNASLITWKHLIMTQLWQPTATCSLASNVMQTRWGLGGEGGGRGLGGGTAVLTESYVYLLVTYQAAK